MQFPHHESGLQFLGRLIKRPSLQALDVNLFPDDIKPKEVIEVAGDVNCGKTYLVSQLMAKCILPKCFNGVQIGGLNVSVVLVNTDYHFKIFKLVSLMKSHLNKYCDPERLDSSVIESILTCSLNRITIYNCIDSNHFKILSRLLSQLVLDDPNIGLVIIDSISAYYWQDRQCGGEWKYDAFVDGMLKHLEPVSELQVPVIYTKPSYFKSRVKRDSKLKTNQAVTRKIHLSGVKVLENGDACYKCYVISSSSQNMLLYKIDSNGLNFISIEV